ncbi:putative MOB kinase activator family [Helianthus anomalus]
MIIKGLFRRYGRWNHVFTTSGVFWGMGTSFGCGIRNQRTFRPKKSAPSGSKGAQLRQHIDATLGSGNLREAVRLPPGEDINEWLAPIEVSAPKYVELLIDWIESQMDDESIFPQRLGNYLITMSVMHHLIKRFRGV